MEKYMAMAYVLSKKGVTEMIILFKYEEFGPGMGYPSIRDHLRNEPYEEKEKIIDACKDAEVSIGYEDGAQQIYLNGENITAMLREEAVGNMASISSAVPEVRAKLLDLQRNLAKEKDVVMDGRDIGTHVLPNADVKIYLTASVECRANRRFKELTEKGIACNYDEIAQDIQERDTRDMNREIAPLKKADDAVLVDSSDMTIEEVVKAITGLCR